MGFDYNAALAERHAQEDRLRAAGFFPDAGGVYMTTGQWEIFVYRTEDSEEFATVLTSVAEVDEFISGNNLVGAMA